MILCIQTFCEIYFINSICESAVKVQIPGNFEGSDSACILNIAFPPRYSLKIKYTESSFLRVSLHSILFALWIFQTQLIGSVLRNKWIMYHVLAHMDRKKGSEMKEPKKQWDSTLKVFLENLHIEKNHDTSTFATKPAVMNLLANKINAMNAGLLI